MSKKGSKSYKRNATTESKIELATRTIMDSVPKRFVINSDKWKRWLLKIANQLEKSGGLTVICSLDNETIITTYK